MSAALVAAGEAGVLDALESTLTANSPEGGASGLELLEKQRMTNETTPVTLQVNWDYTDHAAHYDKRADYSDEAIASLVAMTGAVPGKPVGDIGAGTGKLTKELLKHGLTVRSVEPNGAMRQFGIANTAGCSVKWTAGTGEETGLESGSVHSVFFGSSFNVVDQGKALAEVVRILVPGGWFACMWNHRDLDDPVQQRIESIIKSHIPAYSYGTRREDPTAVIESSGYFQEVKAIEGSFRWDMSRSDIIVAWKSHATLRRQAETEACFDAVIHEIEDYLNGLGDTIAVPYTTRIYVAQSKVGVSAAAPALEGVQR
jgi:SAM-dependent methyltransferase